MKRKKKSVCDFVGLKSNKLHYKFNECKKIHLKQLNVLISKTFQIHANFAVMILTSLLFY